MWSFHVSLFLVYTDSTIKDSHLKKKPSNFYVSSSVKTYQRWKWAVRHSDRSHSNITNARRSYQWLCPFQPTREHPKWTGCSQVNHPDIQIRSSDVRINLKDERFDPYIAWSQSRGSDTGLRHWEKPNSSFDCNFERKRGLFLTWWIQSNPAQHRHGRQCVVWLSDWQFDKLFVTWGSLQNGILF